LLAQAALSANGYSAFQALFPAGDALDLT